MKRKVIAMLVCSLIVFSSACSLQRRVLPTPTLESPPVIPTADPTVPVIIPISTDTPLPPQPIPMATSGEPLLTLDMNYFCNIGPGANYIDVVDYPVGTILPIIGSNGAGWWLVRIDDPRTHHTECWIGGGTANGDTSHLPVPTPGLFVPVHDESHWSTVIYLDCSNLTRYTWVWNGASSGEYVTTSTFRGITGRPTIFHDEWIGVCPSFVP